MALVYAKPGNFSTSERGWVVKFAPDVNMHNCYRPLPSSKNPHFQSDASCTTFIVKDFYLHENKKMISISRAEHLPSF